MLFDHDLQRCRYYEPGMFEALEGRYTEDDKATRARLERASPRAPRRNFVDILNGETRGRVGEIGLEGIAKIRDRYQYDGGRRTAAQHNAAHERFEKSADFNRLHPASRSHLRRASDFDLRPGEEPGNPFGSRFQWSDEFAPPQGVRRVPDARGSVQGDNERGRHFAGGEPGAVDLDWMLEAARMLIEAVRSRGYGRGRV